jgi:tRNA-specific 2-thiouridylase
MISSERVVVAMSGGVDSAVAAGRLVEQGYDVTGVMLHLWSEPGKGAENRCCTPQAVRDARRVARALDIPFHVLNCARRFKTAVVDPFVEAYACGRTPNPCLACNRRIKFGYLLDMARVAGAAYLATGHYASVRRTNGIYQLRRGADARKDQSYFLYALGQEQLEHVLFPLGGYTKPQVRALAEQWDLPVAEKDESQDICFVRDQDYSRFLHAYAPETLEAGPILDSEGRKLGEHQGLPLYTIGQRRGIGLTWSEPLYVLEKDTSRKALIVGPASQLGWRRFQVESVRFVSGQRPSFPAEVSVKIRSTSRKAEAVLRPGEKGKLRVEVERPLRDVTPGQTAVFYRGQDVLGGGIISSSDRRPTGQSER